MSRVLRRRNGDGVCKRGGADPSAVVSDKEESGDNEFRKIRSASSAELISSSGEDGIRGDGDL